MAEYTSECLTLVLRIGLGLRLNLQRKTTIGGTLLIEEIKTLIMQGLSEAQIQEMKDLMDQTQMTWMKLHTLMNVTVKRDGEIKSKK